MYGGPPSPAASPRPTRRRRLRHQMPALQHTARARVVWQLAQALRKRRRREHPERVAIRLCIPEKARKSTGLYHLGYCITPPGAAPLVLLSASENLAARLIEKASRGTAAMSLISALSCLAGRHRPLRRRVERDGHSYTTTCRHCGTKLERVSPGTWRKRRANADSETNQSA